MARKLKLWNGRPYSVLPRSRWKMGVDSAHIYVCAHSVADIQKLCMELGLDSPPAYEISKYWNAGHWGNTMDGVTPERGVWVQYGFGPKNKPVRIMPEGEQR